MDANLGDALSGLLLLSSDSNNDSDDGSMTHITNDSDVNPTSINSSSTQANSGSMDVSTTPPAAETKRRKYKKRGSTGFIRHKGTKVSRGSSKATHATKQCASAAILESTNENEDNTAAVKICQDDKRKLISLFYLQIGAPPTEDWYGGMAKAG